MCGQSVLSNEFPIVGKNHQDPNGGVDHLGALDQFAVQDPQEATAASNPRTYRKGGRGGLHPPGQRLPWLLVDWEEDEDVAYMYAFPRRAVVLRLQIRSEPDEN